MVNSVSSNYESTQREYKPPIPPAGILRPVEVAFSLSVWIWNCTDAILSSMPIKMKQRRKKKHALIHSFSWDLKYKAEH